MSNRIPNSEAAVDPENDPVRNPAPNPIRGMATKVLKERFLSRREGTKVGN